MSGRLFRRWAILDESTRFVHEVARPFAVYRSPFTVRRLPFAVRRAPGAGRSQNQGNTSGAIDRSQQRTGPEKGDRG